MVKVGKKQAFGGKVGHLETLCCVQGWMGEAEAGYG
ncbi:hypothetical protein MSL71_7360 [Desulfoluna butyratoxydans]|uniref:Uncharacterized protein n=1 Tax=Desulfoluna butyratoxydans TaxID=231438 RepID=A0A4U8YJ94_9BACT|nr:hypothetical protein MSL71_7360 [Desulfoluna butyratoxydans]